MSERLDGRLTEPELKALADHVSACPRCRAQWRRLEKLAALLADWRVPPAPPDLADRLAAAAGASVDVRRPWWRGPLRWAAVLATAAVLAGTFVFMRDEPKSPVADSAPDVRPVDDSQFFISPDLPPDVAEWCRKHSPAAGDAVLGWGGEVALSLTDAADRVVTTSGTVQQRVTRVTDRVVKTQLPSLMNGVDRLRRALKLRRGEDGADPREGAAPRRNRVLVVKPCDGCSEPV